MLDTRLRTPCCGRHVPAARREDDRCQCPGCLRTFDREEVIADGV